MPIPSGAYAVKFHISQYSESSGNPEIIAEMQFQVDPTHPQGAVQDAAATAAANAYVAELRQAYPAVPVNASRQYLCTAVGDPWPTL